MNRSPRIAPEPRAGPFAGPGLAADGAIEALEAWIAEHGIARKGLDPTARDLDTEAHGTRIGRQETVP